MRLKNHKELLSSLFKRYGGKTLYTAVFEPTHEHPHWEMQVSFVAGDFVRIITSDIGRNKRQAKERVAERAFHIETKAILSVIGQRGMDKGNVAEMRVHTMLNEPNNILPKWIVGASRVTKQQDGEHIDIIVHTKDIGDLYVQVKSNERAKKGYMNKYGHLGIEVVVVRPVDTDDIVLQGVLHAIRIMRQRKISQMRKALRPQ